MNTYKGEYLVENTNKYIGTKNPLTFRSSWESRVCNYLDLTPRVIRWAYESVCVPYFNPLDNKNHRYFVDFYLELSDMDNKLKKYLVEVKPFKQGPIINSDGTFDFSNKPKPPKNKTKKSMTNFMNSATTYATNTYKWKSAIEFSRKNGWIFRVVTENEIFNFIK